VSDATVSNASDDGDDDSILLSILIPTIPRREWLLAGITRELERQAALRREKDVEILVLRDNKLMSIGDKRNRLVSIARGKYVSFVDDDDRVSPDYVEEIVTAAASDPDVICFGAEVNTPSTKPMITSFSPKHTENSPRRRLPNHLCAWRREIASVVPYRNVSFGEDADWPPRAAEHVHVFAAIDKVLYHYDYDPATSETKIEHERRDRRRGR